MSRLRLIVFLALMTMAPLAAFAQQDIEFARDRIKIATPAGRLHAFTVELATTPRQLAQGLMHRPRLAKDAGMLFDFGTEQPVSMWMKNTLIPLDMVFIAKDGQVKGVAANTEPHSLAVISSPGPVRAVLELNAGTAARLGIEAGAHVDHAIFR